MVEVFALERTSPSATRLTTSTMSGARSLSPSIDSLKTKENDQRKQSIMGNRTGYRRVRVGLSDLHSSIKDGCLM